MKHEMIFYDGPLAGNTMIDEVEYEKGKCRDIFSVKVKGEEYIYYLIQETTDKFCYSLLKKKLRIRLKNG